MFTLIQCPQTNHDYMTRYIVRLDKEYTLYEFIDAILTNNKDERGRIKIKIANSNIGKTVDCDHYPGIDYRYGNIASKPNIPEKVFGYKVKSVTAREGWLSMIYIVTLEKEVE